MSYYPRTDTRDRRPGKSWSLALPLSSAFRGRATCGQIMPPFLLRAFAKRRQGAGLSSQLGDYQFNQLNAEIWRCIPALILSLVGV